ncbi:MAG: VOC family protein [Candidatus Eremiobacteraeota bacterium]|nr:VOC family protein [Candidatus Eremiobacteraeota bacterium]
MALFSHVDLRVRRQPEAFRFYNALLGSMGFHVVKAERFDEHEPTWRRAGWVANDEFFGFIVDPEFVANQTRLAFAAKSPAEVDRLAAVALEHGANDYDPPHDYGGYYAAFFEDPDGNRLEICYLQQHGGLAADPLHRS